MSKLLPRSLPVALALSACVALCAAFFSQPGAAASPAPANKHKHTTLPKQTARSKHTARSKSTARLKTAKPQCPAEPFVAGCALPFDNPTNQPDKPTPAHHPIDDQCPIQGNCNMGEGSLLQNKIKNNYCATGTPVAISVATIDALQAAVDKLVANHQITYGVNNTPPRPQDRPKLHNLQTVNAAGNPTTLSEGDLVSFEGFVFDAKHDDTFPLGFKGEGVNCNNPALEWNDIHIAIVQTSNIVSADECGSVTAEIIPHSRPVLWDRFDTDPATKAFVTNPLPMEGRRIRVTGQLFFDGSHKPRPCAGPRRRSSWEVHPVYKIEVFDNGGFITLETWAANHHLN